MKKVMIMILVFVSSLTAQESVKVERGRQIVEEARKAVEKKSASKDIKGIYLKINSNINDVSVFREFSYQFSDKLYHTYSSSENAKSITIWSGDKYFEDYEMILNDKVIRQSVINAKLSKERAKKQSEGTLPNELKEIEKKTSSLPSDSKSKFLGNMWYYVFPVILQASFEPAAQFEYVGKAEAGNGQKADVVDVKSSYLRKFRLFFDEKTHLLLMMTVTAINGDNEYQERFYYSDYQLTDGILVAKRIQRESRNINVNTKVENKLGDSFTTIEEFKLNPKFSGDLFQID